MVLSRRAFTKAGLGTAISFAAGGVLANEHEGLLRRAIPSSGEMIPIIGVGTNRYGVGDNRAAREILLETLGRFAELGGTFIDTAPSYRSSESVLGDLIADLELRDSLFLATKQDQENTSATTAQMEQSLRRLQTDRVDLMQVHSMVGWKHALPIMREWKRQGRIRYIGITTDTSREYSDFEQIMRSEDLDFVQLNYSIEQREAADRLLPLAADRGMAVIINRAFGGGRVFSAVGNEAVPQWAREFDCSSWAQVLLKYALSHPAATLAIPGMTKAHHVEDNMMAGQGRMPDASERQRIEAFYDSI